MIERFVGRQGRAPWPVFVFIVAQLAACGGTEKAPEVYLEQAAKAFEAGELQASFIDVKNALRAAPDDPEARFLLGRLYLARGQAEAALGEIERAAGAGLDEDRLILPRAQAMTLLGRTDQVLVLPVNREALSTEDRAELHALRGNAFLIEREGDRAEAEYDKALELVPGFDLALVGRIKLALARGDLDAAVAAAAAALENAPDKARTQLFAGDVEMLQGHIDTATERYRRATELDPEDAGARSKLTLAHITAKDLDAAAASLKQLEAMSPKSPDTLYARGFFEFVSRDFEAAVQPLAGALEADPSDLRAMYLLGAAHRALGNNERALENLERFLAFRPASVPAARLVAQTHLIMGETDLAMQTVKAARSYHPKEASLLALESQIAVVANDPERAVATLRELQALEPDTPNLQLGLGLGLLETGETEAAIDALERAVASGADPDRAQTARLLAYVRAGDGDRAVELAREYVAENPDRAQPYNALGTVQLELGNSDAARAAFEEGLRQLPGEPTLSHNLAVMDQKAGRPEEAMIRYERVLEAHPKDVATLVRAGTLGLTLGRGEDAAEHLEKALSVSPGNALARARLARYRYQTGDKAAARALIAAAPNAGQPVLLAELASIQMRDGEYLEAVETLVALTRADEARAETWLELARLQDHVGQAEAARASFVQAYRHRAGDIPTNVVLARGLYDAGERNLAVDLARELADQAPNDQNVRLLEAWLARRDGDLARAVTILSDAHRETGSRATTFALAQARALAGDLDAATRLLEDWQAAHPDDAQAWIAKAQLELDAGLSDRAGATLTELLERRPDSAPLMNEIALLLADSDPKEARSYAERANELAPDTPEIQDTLARLLLAEGATERALGLLEAALEGGSDSPAIRLHFAEALIAAGAQERGLAELDQVLAQVEAGQLRAEAEALKARTEGL